MIVEKEPPPSSTHPPRSSTSSKYNSPLLYNNNQSFTVSSQISAQTMASPPRQVGVCIADLLARIPDSSAEPEQSSFEEFQFGNFPLAEESTPGLEPLVEEVSTTSAEASG